MKKTSVKSKTTRAKRRSKRIEACRIHRTFGSGNLAAHILKGIDLTIYDGEFVAIMGRSGAGKSTLLYQLSLLDEPTEGQLKINGRDALTFNEAERTDFRLHNLGFVFQDYALVPDLNAEENVMMPLLMQGQSFASARALARQALTAVGLSGHYINLPSQLSGGEQQRASIARAIAGQPAILFADEPTANLDSLSGRVVIDHLIKLNKEHGQTIVMVTHEYEYTTGCDRIINMEDGKIVAESPTEKKEAKTKTKTRKARIPKRKTT